MRQMIIGYRSGITKDGYPYALLFGLKDIPSKQGCYGQEVDVIKCTPEIMTQLRPELVGNECDLQFARNFRGEAVCSAISL